MDLAILETDASPRAQAVSPLFNRLPTELRLMIYTFVFVGCRTTVWVNGIFGEYSDDTEVSHGSPRRRRFRPGLRCYNHSGGGFGLLTTCRMVYIEAAEAYWSETILNMKILEGHYSYYSGCELQQVCEDLPVTIKESLRHLRNVRLPIIKEGLPTCGDTNWTPFLLGQLPKLVSCGFSGFGHRNIHLAGGLSGSYRFTVPDSQNIAQCYYGVGRFGVEGCESPAAFLERTIGVQRSCGITMLSMAIGYKPRPCPDNYKFRLQYFNYTTGMVYQTTMYQMDDEDGFQEAMRTEEGSEWSHFC